MKIGDIVCYIREDDEYDKNLVSILRKEDDIKEVHNA